MRCLIIVKNMNYKIPEDMSIISFTNGELPKYVSPTITTVSQHGVHIGETSANMLIDRLEAKEDYPYRVKVIKTSLIERASTKPLT